MSLPTSDQWQAENQRYLLASLRIVQELIDHHAAAGSVRLPSHGNGVSPEAQKELLNAQSALSDPSALERVCAVFSLTPFERDVLLLAAGNELDPTFSVRCAAAHGVPSRIYPTFSLALSALPDPHWSALLPISPLRRWGLLKLGDEISVVRRPLRIDERVLHYLAGLSYCDEQLEGVVVTFDASNHTPSLRDEDRRAMTSRWSDRSPMIVEIVCDDPAEGRQGFVEACASAGMRACGVRAADIPASPDEREHLARLWEREAMLDGAALLVDGFDLEEGPTRSALAWMERLSVPAALLVHEPTMGGNRPRIRIEVQRPSTVEQLDLWRRVGGKADLGGDLARIVSQFDLSAGTIEELGARVLDHPPSESPRETAERLWDACRAQTRNQMQGLAQRISPRAHWDDLILPVQHKDTLRDIVSFIRQRYVLYEVWGFAEQSSRGLAITALFAGGSGTGKTMAAEVLANELCLDLYRIDLSQVISKYIGETEKNLKRLFDAAERGGAILFFDEADALFGKRSEVKDSHDRYANIEISYLLQRMEEFRGLAILATNMKEALDQAFLRRLRFIVQFPFPDVAHRTEIWKKVFPAKAPTQDLNFERLARLNVPGGNIRNIAMYGAFLAADAQEPVLMKHLLHAARIEYAKLERPLTESEIGGWM